MKKAVCMILAALMMLAMLPSIGSALQKDAVTIAVVPKGLDNRIFLDVKAGAEMAGEELGITILWAGSATSDTDLQIEEMERLIEQGVDGILLSCNDAEQLIDVIDQATAASIKVATFDSDAPDSSRLFYVGSDNYALGLAAANHIRALLPEGGKVGILEGLPDALNLQTRLSGFFAGLIDSDIQCYPAVSGQDDFQTSVDVVEEFTAKTPELDAWFLLGGWPLFASPEDLPNLSAFAEAGGKVVAVDAAWPMLQFVEAGIVDVLLGQGYSEMGDMGIRRLYAALQGESQELAEDSILYAAIEEVTIENLDAVRLEKTPW